MLGGRIWVESEPGQGSTFAFTAVFGRGAEEAVDVAPAPDVRGLTALVVDDSEAAREIMTEALESFSLKPEAVASGREAVEALERADSKGRPFDLVLMDWKMPGMDGIEATKQIKESPRLSRQPKVLMVSAFGREEVKKAAQEAGVGGFLIKPVSNSVLFDSIIEMFGHESRRKRSRSTSARVRPEDLQPIRGAKVLLVEDNEINQQVATELLQTVGLAVTVAGDGRQGVEAALGGDFDIVLMDIEMPVLDGLEATRRIRASDRPGIADLPIVAMTAHAMTGDHDKSLEAGMNDHLTKPIDPDKLFAALLKWVHPGERQPSGDQEAERGKTRRDGEEAPLPHLPGIAVEAGVARVGGNRRLYRELLVKFAREYTDSPRQIRASLDAEDWDTARRLAHTVKGVAGSLGAAGVEGVDAELEAALKERDADSVQEKLDGFGHELEAITRSLRSVVEARDESRSVTAAAAPGDLETLRNLLREIEPHLEKRRPRHAREVMEKLGGFAWTGRDAESIQELEKLVGKYRFKEARAVVAAVLARAADG